MTATRQVGKSITGDLEGGSWIAQVLQAVNKLTLQVQQPHIILQITANAVRCLPGHYLVHQASPGIFADLRGRFAGSCPFRRLGWGASWLEGCGPGYGCG